MVPYLTMVILCGIPLLFMEFSIGQYTRLGPVHALAKICPLLKGEWLCRPWNGTCHSRNFPWISQFRVWVLFAIEVCLAGLVHDQQRVSCSDDQKHTKYNYWRLNSNMNITTVTNPFLNKLPPKQLIINQQFQKSNRYVNKDHWFWTKLFPETKNLDNSIKGRHIPVYSN